MAQEDTEVEQLEANVREYFERTWGEGDLSVIDKQFADDYVGHVPLQPEAIGPEGYKRMVRTYRTAFPDVEASIEDLVVEGETVAVRYMWSGTHEGELLGIDPTGQTVEGSGMAFFRFEDGQRTEDWILDDTFGLMQQLGVLEPLSDRPLKSRRLNDNGPSTDVEGPDDTVENPVTGARVTFLRRARDTDGEFARVEAVLESRWPGLPEHVHEHQEEHFSVQAGTMEGSVDGEPFRLEPGEELTVSSGTPHAVGNGGDDELRVLIEARPARRFEELYEVFYGLARDGKTDDEGLPNLLQLAVIGQAYWEDYHTTSPAPIVQKVLFAVLAPIGRLLGYRAYYPKYSPLHADQE